eukprot:4959810-Amphidinium_carterae.3
MALLGMARRMGIALTGVWVAAAIAAQDVNREGAGQEQTLVMEKLKDLSMPGDFAKVALIYNKMPRS